MWLSSKSEIRKGVGRGGSQNRVPIFIIFFMGTYYPVCDRVIFDVYPGLPHILLVSFSDITQKLFFYLHSDDSTPILLTFY